VVVVVVGEVVVVVVVGVVELIVVVSRQNCRCWFRVGGGGSASTPTCTDMRGCLSAFQYLVHPSPLLRQ
jgi:hypothetical protein